MGKTDKEYCIRLLSFIAENPKLFQTEKPN